MKRVALMALMLVSLSSVATEIYKWKDANGNIVYGETPPHEVEAQSMNATAKRAKNDKKSKVNLEEKQKEAQREKLEAELAAQEAQYEKELKEYCDYNREQVSKLNNSTKPVKYIDNDGKAKLLLQQERSEKIKAAQKNLQKHCS